MQNICCNNSIQFVDWEASEYAPVWFDIALLVEILIDYRTEWHENADDIRRHCVQLYTSEMKKHGITFKMEPLTLYKMAYIQRTLERWLRVQLRYAIKEKNNSSIPIFTHHILEKITVWGKELGLY